MIDAGSRPMARPKMADLGVSPVSHAGRAGFLAALIMLGVQLLWRNEWSQGGGRLTRRTTDGAEDFKPDWQPRPR